MLRYKLLHPGLAGALGGAGHGTKVLVADGNYPFGTGAAPGAARVYLNLAPGLVNATDVLRVLVDAVPIEAAEVMMPPDGREPPIFEEFRQILGGGVPLRTHARLDFYVAARAPDTAIVVATGERRIYANVLLTIGVVPP
jgi:L-fucose mutarotase